MLSWTNYEGFPPHLSMVNQNSYQLLLQCGIELFPQSRSLASTKLVTTSEFFCKTSCGHKQNQSFFFLESTTVKKFQASHDILRCLHSIYFMHTRNEILADEAFRLLYFQHLMHTPCGLSKNFHISFAVFLSFSFFPKIFPWVAGRRRGKGMLFQIKEILYEAKVSFCNCSQKGKQQKVF